jgi:dihydroorotase
MPNTRPVNDSPESTRALIEHAKKIGLARVFPIAAVSKGSEGEDLTDFAGLIAAGAVAFSDDGRPVKTPELMRRAMEMAQPLGIPIIDHCEDPALSAGGAINQGPVSERVAVKGIPNASEDVCVARDLSVAEETGAHLHVAHLSTARACEMVREAKRRGVRVTCEVTPHHFTLTDDAVEKYGTNAKMNPPLRSMQDLQGILAGIAGGVVDVLATDHAPHAPELKSKSITDAPFGIIGFETALALALTQLVHPGKISLAHLIVLMSSNPAHIIRQNVNPGLGRLQVGGAADITVFDPAREWTYHAAEGKSKSRNSPFDGWKLKGFITKTVVSGRVVFNIG